VSGRWKEQSWLVAMWWYRAQQDPEASQHQVEVQPIDGRRGQCSRKYLSLLLVAWASSEQARSLERRLLLWMDMRQIPVTVILCWPWRTGVAGRSACAPPQVLSPVGMLLFGCVTTWVKPAWLILGASHNGYHGGSAGDWRSCLCALLTGGLSSQ